MGGAKPAAFEVAYREQDGEVAPVVALADGQPKSSTDRKKVMTQQTAKVRSCRRERRSALAAG
jgi:hypothetical protein